MPYIQCKSLVKKYDISDNAINALDNVSLDIEKGDFLAVSGPSGSGKSTFMNMLGGLDRPDSGTVTVDGLNLQELSDREISRYRNQLIGFVFQDFNLLGSLTALENVMLPLRYAGIPGRQRVEMAQYALELVGLAERTKHRPSELSGGQRQRVSIARAIVNNPKIILADEPTGNLDSRSGERIMELLDHLNSSGYTLLIVTHNIPQAESVKRIVEIRDGKITCDNRLK